MIPQLAIGPQIALAIPCAYNTSPSADLNTPTPNLQFYMHMSLYFDRWIAGTYPGSDWVYAYVNTKTEVWWTRSDPNYDVYGGQQTNSWFFNAINCATGLQDPRSANGGNWAPSWQSASESVHYLYFGPMNSWPVLFNPLYQGYDIHMSQTTQVAYLGELYSSLSNTYVPPKN